MPDGAVLDFIRSYRESTRGVMDRAPEEQIARFIEMLADARQRDRQIFFCGNGGSAATATHFANDLGKDASVGREKRFRALSLTDNIPWMTALANDLDYSQIFVEQLKNHARPGDMLVAFSTSGNSPNIVAAVEWANARDLITVGITGRPGGRLGELAGHAIFMESTHPGHIQEGHFLLQHLVSYYFVEADR